ncbi:MAG: DUF523 and DUF1722 domain-containing protein [Candidatus Gracilibacteria bacterium]|nr:DUF523 and DUF1722 domain-containing protein [Candidatus Gracilibacteria bacterium]
MNKIFYKPNIIISKCLNFDNCRFNGDMINDNFLKKLGEFVNYIPVCPEVAIGLGVPRMPLRLVNIDNETRLLQPSSKSDLTDKMDDFSIEFLKKQKNIDGFIMKNRSPSCGIKDVKIYDKEDSHTINTKHSAGIFGKNILEIYNSYPIEDEGRLKNFRLREEFLTKIFCLAEFREISRTKKIVDLTEFQAKNKYLFMFYSQSIQVLLGQILASYNKENIEEIYSYYYKQLLKLFDNPTKIGKMINSLNHIFGYFKDTCSKEEKEFFIETLDVYREGRIPTSSVISILKTWALRDKKEYILKQTILNPFPKELIELSDSGRLLEL